MKLKKTIIICGTIAAFLMAGTLGGAMYLVNYALAPEDGTQCYESENF